jgi:hypothetical protein
MGLKPARNTLLKAEHLEDCLVIVQGHSAGESPSTLPGAGKDDTYAWVRSTTAVIDGFPGEPVTEQAGTDELPLILEDMRWAESAIADELKGKVGGYDADGTPKLSVGVIQRYKTRFRNDAFRLGEPTDEQFNAAVKYVEQNPDVFPSKDAERAAAAFA